MRYLFFLVAFLPNLVSAQRKGTGPNPCELIKRPVDCNAIERNVKQLLKGDDNCVLALIDTVCGEIVKTGDRKYLIALDTIAMHSDGYVSEYLLDIGVKLYYKRLPLLAHYLTTRDLKNPGAIEKLIVESMSMYLSTAKSRDQKRKKIEAYVDQAKAKKEINDQEYVYLEGLMKRFDPKMFD
jgi:hypothetical protein